MVFDNPTLANVSRAIIGYTWARRGAVYGAFSLHHEGTAYKVRAPKWSFIFCSCRTSHLSVVSNQEGHFWGRAIERGSREMWHGRCGMAVRDVRSDRNGL